MENMNTYFENLPTDPDTKIIKTDFKLIKDIPVRLEIWLWDGITGASAIMPNSFVKNISDDKLVELIRTEVAIKDGYTIQRDGEFTFINFGFIAED